MMRCLQGIGLGELPAAPRHRTLRPSSSSTTSGAFQGGGRVPGVRVRVPHRKRSQARPHQGRSDGAELLRVLADRKQKVIERETGINKLIRDGDIGPGSQLAQALPAYAKDDLADMALVAQAWPLTMGEWPPPGPLHGSRLVLILKTSDLVADSGARGKISAMFNAGLDPADRDSLVTGKFVLVTNRDKASVQQWPLTDAFGPSNDVFVHDDYKIAFEAAMEVATDLKRRIPGQPDIKVHLVWRSDDNIPPRGSGGVIRGMGGLRWSFNGSA